MLEWVDVKFRWINGYQTSSKVDVAIDSFCYGYNDVLIRGIVATVAAVPTFTILSMDIVSQQSRMQDKELDEVAQREDILLLSNKLWE